MTHPFYLRVRTALSLGCTFFALVCIVPVAAQTSASDSQKAIFCAAAALAAFPSPDEQRTLDPAIVAAQQDFIRLWMERAMPTANKQGEDSAAVTAEINRSNGELQQAFQARAAPFYRLKACDADRDGLLWTSVPAVEGPVSLDRLADDREIEFFRSATGRLRDHYSDLSVAQTFAQDVRMLALAQAVLGGRVAGAADGHLRRLLGQAMVARRIGSPVDNAEHAIAMFRSALDAPNLAAADRAAILSGLCFAWFTRPSGDRADNIERALETCQAGAGMLDKPETRRSWAHVQQVLAGVFHDRMLGNRSDNIELAIVADEAALAVLTRESDSAAWALAQNNLAAHLSDRLVGNEQDNVEAAIAAFEAEGTIISRAFSPPAWAILQDNLAPLVMRREQGGIAANQDRAIASLQDAIAIPNLPGIVISSINFHFGEVYAARVSGDRKGNLEEAVRFYRRALLGDESSERWPILVGHALGKALIGLGRYEEARDALSIAVRRAESIIGLGIDQIEIHSVVADAPDLYTLYAYATAKTGDSSRALELLSSGKARLLFTALAADRLQLSSEELAELNQLRAEFQRRDAAIGLAARNAGGRPAADMAAFDALAALRTRILTLYAKGTRSALAQPTPAEVTADGAVIAPVITEYGAIILVAAPGGSVSAHEAPGLTRQTMAGPIGNGPDALWRNTGDPEMADQGLKALLPLLGATFGRAVRSALDEAGVKLGSRIVILPDGASALLPVNLAEDATTGHFLLDDYRISFAPNLASIATSRERAQRSGDKSLALLTPSADARLSYAPIEGAMVRATFSGTGSEAWQSPGKAVLLGALAPHGYWHFATHGTFDWSDPRRSGVLVGARSEWLTVADLLDRKQPTGAPRLVVLSACETGISDVRHNPDEFTGLPAGFIFAGAAGVVATLWPVDDLSTTLLMKKFYENHIAGRLAPDQALRDAQKWLRDAKLGDLEEAVRDWRAAGIVTAEQADDMADDLRSDAESLDPNARPFVQPRYWGGFILYGA